MHKKLTYSRSAVDKAGKQISDPASAPETIDAAFEVVNSWRTFHNFPLNTLAVDLKQKVRRVDPSALVARRIKRARSIIAKLRKEQGMRLTQMQDIGGCRAVVNDIESVYRLKDLYIKGRSQHALLSIDDYIRAPKESGYRSLHLVFRFKSNGYPEYNKLLLEVQIRTLTQHAWATAVETVGAMSGQALKSSEGEADWLEYFKYASLALEHDEGTFFSTITPHSLGAIARSLALLEKKLNVSEKLTAYREALKSTDKAKNKTAAYFLLVLLPEQAQLRVFAYPRKKAAQAFKDYEKYERLIPLYFDRDQLPLFPDLENYSGAQAVLVGAESFKSIKETYPNYYLDTKLFLEKVNEFIRRYKKSP